MNVPQGFKTRIAGSVFQDTPSLVVCAETPLLTVGRDPATGRLLVDLTIFDSMGTERARVEGTRLASGKKSDFSVLETDNLVRVRDNQAERVICELQRRDSTKGADVDAYVLAHAPDGFLIHASPEQSNIGGNTTGNSYRNADAALVMKKRKAARKK